MAINIGVASNVLATPVSFLTKDNTNNYYRYDYNDLILSAENNAMDMESGLFDDYYKKQIIAFEDDKNGYIDAQFVVSQSEEACMNDEKFDFETCINTCDESHKANISNNVMNVFEKNGKIFTENISKEFDVLNIY